MKRIEKGFNVIDEAFSKKHKLFPAGSIIYDAGQHASNLYVVKYGTVRVTNQVSQRSVSKDGLFGEETAYAAVYHSTARTYRDTKVGMILRSDLQLLTRDHPEAALALVGIAMGERKNKIKTAPYIDSLTAADLLILQHAANGQERRSSKVTLPKDSGQNYAAKTVYNQASSLIDKLGATNMTQAVFTAYECGFIDGDQAVQDADLTGLNKLTPNQLQLLEMFTVNGGEFSSSASLAQIFSTNERTIRGRLSTLFATLGAKNRTHVGMMYLVAKDRGLLTPQSN